MTHVHLVTIVYDKSTMHSVHASYEGAHNEIVLKIMQTARLDNTSISAVGHELLNRGYVEVEGVEYIINHLQVLP
jgi:hypothetical protein